MHEICTELHFRFGKTDVLAPSPNESLHPDLLPPANLSDHFDEQSSASRLFNASSDEQYADPDPTLELVKFVLSSVAIPVLCLFGIIGNLLSILVLTRRRMKASMDSTMEQAAHASLIALAVSDMGYCLSTAAMSMLTRHQTVYDRLTVAMFVRILVPGIQNTFMHTSTWLTVIMAAGRYAAICRPLQARYLVGVRATRAAVVVTFVVWTVLELPRYWTYEVHELPCQPHTYFVLDHGAFVLNRALKTTFTYVWAIIGFFCPFCVLAYCNFYLIRALRESIRMRQFYRVSPKTATYGSRITPTMVAIVCMFLVLVTPSEILHFYYYTISHHSVELFSVAIALTNVLQTINFAFSFVLYCVVNVHFWETWKGLVFCFVRREWHRGRRRWGRRNSTNSNATKGSFVAQSTVETLV